MQPNGFSLFQHPLRVPLLLTRFERLVFHPVSPAFASNASHLVRLVRGSHGCQPVVSGAVAPNFSSTHFSQITLSPVGSLGQPRWRALIANRVRCLSFGAKVLGILSLMLPLAYFGVKSTLSMPATASQASANQPMPNVVLKPSATNLPTASLVSLPTPMLASKTLDHIQASHTLRVATVVNGTTYFAKDGFEHGFGHDVLQSYAHHLKVNMVTQVFANEALALEAVKAGKVDMALTTQTIQPAYLDGRHLTAANDDTLNQINLNCGKDYLSTYGLNPNVSLQMRASDQSLLQNSQSFLCQPNTLNTNQHLAKFYTQQVFDTDYSEQHFSKIIKTNLPMYRTAFKQNAKTHDLDWQLLVAMGYQESHLNAEATSPTGVRGIMMLTNDTAEAMGVTDRIDAQQSIEGGAKYLKKVQQQFGNMPNSDRLWFTLAAYNMGPQAIKNIQATLQQSGRNANSWAEVYRYMAENASTNSRYVQCMDYVTNIRGYLEQLKRSPAKYKKVA
ncbi:MULTISPECIES: transglycosylase SLT domain-containing protein [unclassified Moraxella]|uniref:transglycosylase SLT domain-containing protein n=1 Tax=unclassified Moraxella TaxID=2685852 RepID=UPI003AF6C0E0